MPSWWCPESAALEKQMRATKLSAVLGFVSHVDILMSALAKVWAGSLNKHRSPSSMTIFKTRYWSPLLALAKTSFTSLPAERRQRRGQSPAVLNRHMLDTDTLVPTRPFGDSCCKFPSRCFVDLINM